MEAIYCNAGSGWACNEWGILEHRFVKAGVDRGDADPMTAFSLGCESGADYACDNRNALSAGRTEFVRGQPTLDDYPIILRGSKAAITDLSAPELYERACAQGWPGTCGK